MTILLGFWVMVAMFFRIPRRIFTEDSTRLIAPADGVIVTIEETMEKEYIKEECIQISIFMNGTDVHVNRYPCDGTVEYYKFHRGNYFVASYPKSSVLNPKHMSMIPEESPFRSGNHSPIVAMVVLYRIPMLRPAKTP